MLEVAPGVYVHGTREAISILQARLAAPVSTTLGAAEGVGEPATLARPCPFCGKTPYITRTVNGTQMFKVGCASCGVELKAAWYRGEDAPTRDILTLWNTRVPNA